MGKLSWFPSLPTLHCKLFTRSNLPFFLSLASGWQPRYFVLENGILSYYDSQDDVGKGSKGSIKMAVCEIKGRQFRYCTQIRKKHHLSFSNFAPFGVVHYLLFSAKNCRSFTLLLSLFWGYLLLFL